jgi:DNA-binding NarL/FixJ family response regulator
MVVLGQASDAAATLRTARDAHADMLIMQSQQGEAGVLDAIVGGPSFSILAISATGEEATAVRLIHEAVAFDPSSHAAFAAAIRRLARSAGPPPLPGESRWQG